MLRAAAAALTPLAHRPAVTTIFYGRKYLAKALLSTVSSSSSSPSPSDSPLDRAKHLLITLDAFGTLYVPRKPVEVQYASVAKELGLGSFASQTVANNFFKAFKALREEHPNYGHATGMAPKQWWKEVVTKTFTPLLPAAQQVPPALPEALWHRFSSKASYALLESTVPFFSVLDELKLLAEQTRAGQTHWEFKTITVGVISNSDDRVASVLESLGIRVNFQTVSASGEMKDIVRGPPAAAAAKEFAEERGPEQTIDFVTTSYNVGFEKPRKEIFMAAMATAKEIIRKSYGDKNEIGRGEWHWCHIGDDVQKDVVGSLNAGGFGVLFDKNRRETELERAVSLDGVGADYKVMVVKDLREVLEMLEGMEFMYERLPSMGS
ncbi:hypothetical protein ABW20_dc0101168 [Dactylellina cionopaga]|nr:hypothetical protein ABW20_dc0101168 [Dactylellina cionopaga]